MDGYGGQEQIPMDNYGGNENTYSGSMARGPRPVQDPQALGEVDPNVYPEPKESTHKVRGKSDIIEMLFGPVDQELLMVKTFYFFFYSAFGSLFPLMGVYFKQMGMNAGQCGFLIGSRPFVEFLAAPFWGGLADRWQKGKTLLLASLSCWILFTLPLGFIQPPAASCLMVNKTHFYLEAPNSRQAAVQSIAKREAPNFNLDTNDEHVNDLLDSFGNSINSYYNSVNGEIPDEFFNEYANRPLIRHTRRVYRPYIEPGQSPTSVQFAANYDPKTESSWVIPIFSTIVYRTEDIQKSFFLLILLVIIGEFFSAPAITLADSAVITLLGEDADKYGHQRMFGSLGWGLAMFFVGIALDHSTAFPDHPCVPDPREKNYTICFATFSVLMGAALITATQINFKYDPNVYANTEIQIEKTPEPMTQEDKFQQQLAQQLNCPALADTSAAAIPPPNVGKTRMFAQTQKEIPEWIAVLKYFANVKCGSFLFVSWFMGFGIGLIFTFLFWHLQDYGGTPTLFGVASVINHISEIFAYFFSFRLITQMGHVKVLCLGLAGNVVRFLYISYLTNPWWVLPFEFMQGITHAAVWAACCSYIAHNTPQHLRSSAQGVLQGIHHGLGRGCGAVFGGVFVSYFGSTTTFRAYGLICALILAFFIFINFYRKDTGFISDLPVTEDPRQVAEETAHLAPHGVPSNPMPRALSSTRIHELGQENNQGNNYGATYNVQGGNLGVPGQHAPQQPQQQYASGGTVSNPFMQESGYNYRNDDERINRELRISSNIVPQSPQIQKSHDILSMHVQQPDNTLSDYAW